MNKYYVTVRSKSGEVLGYENMMLFADNEEQAKELGLNTVSGDFGYPVEAFSAFVTTEYKHA